MATRGYLLWAACLIACSPSDTKPAAAPAAADALTQASSEPPAPALATAVAPADQSTEAQVDREHATGQHVLDNRSDLYASPDVKTRLEFVRNAVASMRERLAEDDQEDHMSIGDMFAAAAPDNGKSPDELLAEAGLDFIETPFGRVRHKMWGRRLLQIVAAVDPLLDHADWSEEEFQLVVSFAEYVNLHPIGPTLSPTGTDPQHDSAELAAFSKWLDDQLCEPAFRGGLQLGIFLLGPLRPRMLDEANALPPTSTTAIGESMELRTVDDPRPDKTALVQAVDESGLVLWTCDVGAMEFASFFDAAERDGPCGWRVALSERPSGNAVVLYLDADRRPSFYMLVGS